MERDTNRSRSSLRSNAADQTFGHAAERIETALANMPEQRRAVFLALRRDGLSYPEIAAQTGLTVSQVEREIAAALLQIDDALERRSDVPSWRRLWTLVLRRIGRVFGS